MVKHKRIRIKEHRSLSKHDSLRIWRRILIFGILITFLLLIWANFFYYPDCGLKECFKQKIVECRRAKFVGEGNMTFEYKIVGPSNDKCEIKVKLLQGDLNNQDSLALIGKDMMCELPLGVRMMPIDDIDNCHGFLKEGLQDLIIDKLHRYIVQNLGVINEEIV